MNQTRLLLAPAAGGKTQAVIDHICALLAVAPLSAVRVVVPDRNQGTSFQRRLASHGALGVRIGTFGDLYAEILAEAGQPFPVTPEPVIHRLVRSAIDRCAERGSLLHYRPIQRRPGLVSVLAGLFAEFKRARITPQRLSEATFGRGPRLEELAALYDEYQSCLVRLEWSDHEGLGWLAASVLEHDPATIQGWRLLVVDGFDSFNPTQVALVEALRPRLGELLLTLTGDLAMSRLAYRRFGRTLAVLRDRLSPMVEDLPARANPVPELAHLEACLFQPEADSVPATSHVAFVEAQNSALEAREALRWLKARIVRDGLRPQECAILARDVTLYRVFLREAAREFGLPLRLACGEPLPSNPAIAAVLNLLELPLQNWARRPLLDALRSPYFDLSLFGLSTVYASSFDAIARAGHVIAGVDQWREATLLAAEEPDLLVDEIEEEELRPPRRPTGAAARAHWDGLRTMIERLMPPAQGSLTEYAQWIEQLLADHGGLQLIARIASQPDTAQRDKLAAQAFATALGALVLGESVVGQPARFTYADFYAELRAVVDATVYRLEDAVDHRLGQVYATSLSAARGVCYRAVAILGLSEGLFPSPLLEDPLLSDEERADLVTAGLPFEPRLRSDQQTLFYEGVSRATEYLLLVRPYLADDGETWQPSPYWSAAQRLFDAPVQRVRPDDRRPHPDAASPAELLAWSVRRRSLPGAYRTLLPEWDHLRHCGAVLRARLDGNVAGQHEGDASGISASLTERYGPAHVWSASRLEAYGGCPFQFFTSVALALQERRPPEPGFDAAQLGSILHEVLEHVYRAASDPLSLDDLLATLPAVAGPIFAAAPQKYGFRPTPQWEAECEELLLCLSRTLTALADCSGPFRPAHFELRFGLPGMPPLVVDTAEGPVRFRGVIDRVDLDASGNLRVIDYKTGASGLHQRDLAEGRRLQLAIYSLAAERCHGLGAPHDGFYWAIQQGQMGQLQLQRFRHLSADGRLYEGARGAIDLAVEHVVTFLRGIRQGLFLPVPPSGSCKGYCPARLFCWRYQPAHA